jgi:hypothetical protein
MASIFEKINLTKQQDMQIALEFSNRIGELLLRSRDNVAVIVKTVDLILKGLKDDESIKAMIQNRLIKDYPDIAWNFKK